MTNDKFEYEEVELVQIHEGGVISTLDRAPIIRERGEAGWVLVATFPGERSLTLGFQRRVQDQSTAERRGAVDELLRILSARGRTHVSTTASDNSPCLRIFFDRSDRDYLPVARRAMELLVSLAPRPGLNNPLDEA